MNKTFIFPLLLLMVIISCEIKYEPIDYNHDECAYCKMKISDPKFGAELVTTKGKIYKFDSAECLLWDYIKNVDREHKFLMVTDYQNPYQFIDAEKATYMISEQQPSPMGGGLSAYDDKELALLAASSKAGKTLTWEELLSEYKEIYQ